MIFDQAGNLYGTTQAGGATDYGVIFKLTPNPDGSWTETLLHHFTGGKDGGFYRRFQSPSHPLAAHDRRPLR